MWQRLRIPGLLAGVVLSAAGAGLAGALAPDGPWRPFVSESGRFRVELPADPVVRPDPERMTLLGPITGEIYRVRARGLELAIEVRDLPVLVETLIPVDFVLEQTRKGVAEDLAAEEVEGREIRLQGLPARDFTYRIPEEPPSFERALAVLVGGRLYLVTGKVVTDGGPVDPSTSAELERFFASFRFWHEAPTGLPDSHPAAMADSP